MTASKYFIVKAAESVSNSRNISLGLQQPQQMNEIWPVIRRHREDNAVEKSPTTVATSITSCSTLNPFTECEIDDSDNFSFGSIESCLMLKYSTGATPLHCAIANNANDSVIMKILHGAPMATSVQDNRGMLPLHYVAAFSHISLECAGQIVATNPRAVLGKTHDGETPLHLAIFNRKKEFLTKDFVKLLILQQPNDENSRQSALLIANDKRLNPLHSCVLSNAPLQVTRLLMQHPMSGRAASMTNSLFCTPLHLAVAQPEVSKSIAMCVTIGTPEAAAVQDRLGRTPLHIAAQNFHATTQLIQFIASLHPKATSMKTQRGHLPLYLAAQSQAKKSVVKALVKMHPKGIHERNKSGNTALHDAAKYGASAKVIKFLLDTNQTIISERNNYGNLPLHCATAHQANEEVIQLLLEAWPDGALTQNRSKDLPLHYAAGYSKSLTVVQSVVAAAPKARLQLNSRGQRPIDCAKANNASKQIIELLRHSREKDSEGWICFPSKINAKKHELDISPLDPTVRGGRFEI